MPKDATESLFDKSYPTKHGATNTTDSVNTYFDKQNLCFATMATIDNIFSLNSCTTHATFPFCPVSDDTTTTIFPFYLHHTAFSSASASTRILVNSCRNWRLSSVFGQFHRYLQALQVIMRSVGAVCAGISRLVFILIEQGIHNDVWLSQQPSTHAHDLMVFTNMNLICGDPTTNAKGWISYWHTIHCWMIRSVIYVSVFNICYLYKLYRLKMQ